MNGIGLYRKMERLKKQGLSEVEIGVRMHMRQWTVSRVLTLRNLTEGMASLLADYEFVTLAALMEIARHPADTQSAALVEMIKLVYRSGTKVIKRTDVAPLLARHSRNLDRAPFPTTSCRPCLKRTGAQADFFGAVAPGALGRCTDAACFARCVNAVAARRARWARKKDFRPVAAGMQKGQKQ